MHLGEERGLNSVVGLGLLKSRFFVSFSDEASYWSSDFKFFKLGFYVLNKIMSG